VLQRVYRAGPLVGAEYRAAPAAWADRLDGGTLAKATPDTNAILHLTCW